MAEAMSDGEYVHGYSEREGGRLGDQARTLADILHHDTAYPSGSRVLELGCGVGAQTVILARNSPGADITSVDISPESVSAAREAVAKEGLGNVTFRVGDIFDLDLPKGSFDHVFICFVLEHLSEPGRALAVARDMLREGGTLTVIEGDHGSAYYYPSCPESRRAVDCLVELQAQSGGDALIGRRLYPLLSGAGFTKVSVSPRMVYVDASRPGLEEGFTRRTFTAMVDGVREKAISGGMMTAEEWERGIRGLLGTTGKGTFCYTFFKGTGTR
jgi:SAM-dependent methyltransferase